MMNPMQLPPDQNQRGPEEPHDVEIQIADKQAGLANKTGDTFWTIPNIICFLRILGSLALIWIAIASLPYWFVGLYLVLAFTDLIDGPIARLLNQRSELGAGLDSLADLLLNACLLVGVSLLSWEKMKGELFLVGVAIASYFAATGYGYWKFKRVPSFHTYSAKVTHFLVAVGGISLILDWSVWPLRIAAIAVLFTNLESVAISRRLEQWKADVPSVFRL